MSMTFGQKLRAARIYCGFTQTELAGEMITRNMLSRLENDQASPSVATLKYLAHKLEIPAGYFIEDVREFDARKLGNIRSIREMLSGRDFENCEKLCLELGSEEECRSDPEICLILAECRIHTADNAYRKGKLTKAARLYESILELCSDTVYDTTLFRTAASVRLRIIDSIKGGVKPERFPEYELIDSIAYDIGLWYGSESHTETEYRKAETEMKRENYGKAAEIYDSMVKKTEDMPVKYRLLTILEECSAKSGDYEKAYTCSRKKLEMLSEFE